MKIIYPILLVLFISSLFLNKYLEKNINKNTFLLFKKITIAIVILSLIIAAIVIFVGSDSKNSRFGWHVKYMDYIDLHKYSTGKSQKIALIDSGISDFQTNKSDKKSFFLVGNEYDNNGHGTMMYSIIKGFENQISGIAPDADIISIKVMDSNEKLSPSLVQEGIKLAIEQGCTIINISIGSYEFNQEISDLINTAVDKGITIVASSGDYESKDMMFPANKANVISVGSLSANGQISIFSNAPSECIINAPGDEIKTINNKKVIENTSGTSQSAAIISGYIALIKDNALKNNLRLYNDDVKNILISINNKKDNYVKTFSSTLQNKE